MAKLKIKNFGPIQNGFSENDGFLEISPVTVICGNQATGKSTIAKLYSISQNKVLYELLECKNNSDENKLLITTHSPYILAYLTQSAKAAELLAKGVPEKEIEKIIPVKAAVSGEKIHIYETKADGSIKLLEPYENLPSDDNELNKALEEQNDSFSDLLELEAKFCK